MLQYYSIQVPLNQNGFDVIILQRVNFVDSILGSILISACEAKGFDLIILGPVIFVDSEQKVLNLIKLGRVIFVDSYIGKYTYY